ncbi:hypothetical protein MKI79_06490 [Acinetobacter sp. A3.8]|uniref:Uncharacterized protein n=1 Tax=Acinetobacter sedimenti TaxID=2919922 RepID=A0A9X1WWN7_9GAMM|nr:hypothetical protein [Acinetobacter sedimenti]MCJ8146549.1 hypothetical protein [Acinetobacter sedimenti]
MSLNSEHQNLWELNNIISKYYDSLNRVYAVFERRYTKDENDGYPGYFVRWLLDRKHVFEYRITEDREMLLSVISMGIGPAYFSVFEFWGYHNAERFRLGVGEEEIIHNYR